MERTAVASRSLRSIGYDAAASELEVEFHSGRVYRFSDVPAQLHAWLMRTPRKGGVFNRLIRDRFPMRDVTPPPASSEADLADALRRSLSRSSPS